VGLMYPIIHFKCLRNCHTFPHNIHWFTFPPCKILHTLVNTCYPLPFWIITILTGVRRFFIVVLKYISLMLSTFAYIYWPVVCLWKNVYSSLVYNLIYMWYTHIYICVYIYKLTALCCDSSCRIYFSFIHLSHEYPFAFRNLLQLPHWVFGLCL
jgi:hypothetical protein